MSSTTWNPPMERYIEILVEAAKGRPVLQFNRADLRLPWLKARFPGARILHIFRHPRDQWCSSLMDIRRFPKEMKLCDFAPFDRFYLLSWGRDLRRYFPFLDYGCRLPPVRAFLPDLEAVLFSREKIFGLVSFEQILKSAELL